MKKISKASDHNLFVDQLVVINMVITNPKRLVELFSLIYLQCTLVTSDMFLCTACAFGSMCFRKQKQSVVSCLDPPARMHPSTWSSE